MITARQAVFQNLCILTSGQLAELEASLNEYCEQFPSSPSFRPAAGSACCAQFTGKNGVKVLSYVT